ncbi:uncharacterized protein [Triticum aestivum]|uniref:uncharacterized protein n=1 Tax=Triticum aestivum TaxID=4565 RepID=UPI001ABC7234|nr:uncharacterized protein LOC123052512 [Triticum aestivum]
MGLRPFNHTAGPQSRTAPDSDKGEATGPTAPNPDPNDGRPCASTADHAAGSRASSGTRSSAGPLCRAPSQPATRGRSVELSPLPKPVERRCRNRSEGSRVSGATSRSRGLWPENASACASAPYGVASWSRIRGPAEGHCAPPSPLYEKIGRGLCLTGATASSSSARCMHAKASSPLPSKAGVQPRSMQSVGLRSRSRCSSHWRADPPPCTVVPAAAEMSPSAPGAGVDCLRFPAAARRTEGCRCSVSRATRQEMPRLFLRARRRGQPRRRSPG